tara:strand:- start:111 stop:341 length:231 start_codon:yes stop_codon:yes gene_type:complete
MPLTKKQQTLPKAIKDKIMKDKKPMKKQTKKDRLDEAEGKKKGNKKKKQGVGARLDEAEGKKKAKKETKKIKERKK